MNSNNIRSKIQIFSIAISHKYLCREIEIFLLPSRHQVTGKMTTKTFLRLLNGQKRVEQYIVHVF